jgi:hypothetical protein
MARGTGKYIAYLLASEAILSESLLVKKTTTAMFLSPLFFMYCIHPFFSLNLNSTLSYKKASHICKTQSEKVTYFHLIIETYFLKTKINTQIARFSCSVLTKTATFICAKSLYTVNLFLSTQFALFTLSDFL